MQASVLAPVSRAARFTEWDLSPGADPGAVRRAIAALAVDADTLVGIGAPLAAYLGVSRDELRGFPAMTGRGVTAPSSQHALLIRAAATDPGAALHAARRAAGPLTGLFRCADATDAAMYDSGRDLTGYVDGTENPTGSAAEAAALASDGSSFLAIQRWVHDLDAFEHHGPEARDAMIGRRRADDVELADAPPSAHVLRTAQEGFTPPAFVVRRSMPWAHGSRHGLVFLAFGHSFDAFEALLGRMLGNDDGVVDALFAFTRPETGGYYWCPPAVGGALAL